MIRFRELGTVDLRDSQGRELRSILRRPKLLALLCYLGAARPHGFHRRDALLTLFWPDLDQAHGRNALRQAVHSLRAALGRDVLVARGEEELGLDSDRLSCDVVEFEKCLNTRQCEAALSLYRGDLLAAFHLSDAREFERWLDLERDHLRRRAVDAALALAKEEEARGVALGAARWASRALEINPYDEGLVRRLLRLLNAAGDRADAMREYDAFARRLRADLDLEPAPETVSLAETIRSRTEARRDHAFQDTEVPDAIGTGPALVERREAGDAAGARRANATEEPADRTDIHPGVPRPDLRHARAVGPGWLARSRPVAMLALVAASFLAGVWLSFGGQTGGGRGARIGRDPSPGLVVLPFKNLGPAQDDYFADGITEEVTARLAAIDRLRVIGGTSARRYKGASKTVREIGEEVAAAHVLQGTLRWQKSGPGPARVRVTAQLLSTADGAQLWAEVYDEPLDEIFRVQSEIARKVVRALDITLRESQRRAVDAVPTNNLEAYDYYLRGNDYWRHGSEERFQRSALRMYEKASELDPGFALAYARASRMHSIIYLFHYDRSQARLAKAKRAVDKAAQLEPNLPEVHHALADYYFMHLNYQRALQELATAEADRPNNAEIFLTRAVVRQRQGDFRRALTDFEKALQFDPGSAMVANNAAQGYGLLREFAPAEALYGRAMALSPDWSAPYFGKTRLYLRRDGNTLRARAVLDEARRVGVADAPLLRFTEVLVELFDRRFEHAVARLSSESPEVIQDQFRFVPRTLLLAEAHRLGQRHNLARTYYDSARRVVARALQDQPNDARLRSALGIAYAGLGRKREAMREGERAVELVPVRREAYRGYYLTWDLARIYTMVGEHDAAIDRLEYLLSIPGDLTAAWLRGDPTWDPLRNDARFRRLVDERKRPVGKTADEPGGGGGRVSAKPRPPTVRST